MDDSIANDEAVNRSGMNDERGQSRYTHDGNNRPGLLSVEKDGASQFQYTYDFLRIPEGSRKLMHLTRTTVS